MSWLAVSAVAFLLAFAAGVPLRDTVDVTLVRSERSELEARVLWGEHRSALHIDAKTNRLLIRSSANGGETFLYGERAEGIGMIYSVEGQTFFTMETKEADGTLTKTEYAVPNSVQNEAKEAFQQRMILQMLASFDQSNVGQSSEGLLHKLLQRPEIKILQETAQELGRRGVVGAENEGALLFYVTVMNMVRGKEGHTAKREAKTETHSQRYDHPSLDNEREGEEDVTQEVLCPEISTVIDSRPPQITPSPRVKTQDSPECSVITNTATSIGRFLFFFATTRTTTYTTTLCPSPTPTLNTPTPSVASSPCQKVTHTPKEPCPSPRPDEYKIPECSVIMNTATSTGRFLYFFTTTRTTTYTTTLCPSPTATPNTPSSSVPCERLPAHLHPCESDQEHLCEDCHHGYECERDRCPFEMECMGMCGPGCWWCWSFVCGDCCYWEGCYQHDNECRERFISFSCLLPFNFSCDGY